MRRLWQRLCRLLGQSRIRLPRTGLAGGRLRVGDRLQIGSQLWRVARAELPPQGRPFFALEALRAADPTAGLVAPTAGSADPWLLTQGSETFELGGELIEHFPIAAAESQVRIQSSIEEI